MTEIEEKAAGVLKATGAHRLLLANSNGQLILDAGSDRNPERASLDAANLASFVGKAWAENGQFHKDELRQVDLLFNESRVFCWFRAPFIVAAYFAPVEIKTAATAYQSQLEELITTLQEELT